MTCPRHARPAYYVVYMTTTRGEIRPENLKDQTKKYQLIDVRRPDEFNGELGHIEGATLVTLGEDLEKFLQSTPREAAIVFICRSGARSGSATDLSAQKGFTQTFNMVGGMLRWNELGYPVERN